MPQFNELSNDERIKQCEFFEDWLKNKPVQQKQPCPFCGCIPEVKGDVVTHRHKDDICIVDDTQYGLEEWNKRADGWISVEDRLPEDSSDVLVFDSEEGMKTAEYELNTFSASENFNTTYRYLNNVTYWMPLPEAPK